MKDLTPFEKSQLKFLQNQEHQCQRESQKRSFEHLDVNQDWDRARRELKEFVSSLRQKGRHI